MNVNGTATIQAERQRVWEFLTHPEGVSQCVPGLESMTILEVDKRFQAIAAVGFGNIKARFDAEVEWLDLVPPETARMKAHATAPGSAVDVIAEIKLDAVGEDQTVLHWSADINIVGTIASLANRMMGSVTDKLSAQFFDCVRQKIEA